ncbi:response regulator transcription factor [Streptosporangium sp. NPDC048865]|uniref:response regulator transcription factor n=1 Tax=Streptosporangium sp. NPDC048865 TaxID=3155766 RepID=UPI0034156333
MIRVLVVDDDPDVRAGLRTILTSDGSVQLVGEATDGHQAVEQVDRCVPDVVLLDIRMPGGDGLTAAAEIRRRWPGQRIIVLTTFGETEYVRRAVRLGVNGFLLKVGDPRDLLAGLRSVMAGGACLAPTVAAMVIGDARSAADRREVVNTAGRILASLPPRERDVLHLVAEGRSNAEIGETLHLSEATVKGYLSSAFARLGVRNRVEAALLVWQAR